MATINLDTLEFFMQQGWQSLRRNGLMAVAAICNMTVAFAVLGVFVLLAWNLEYLAQNQADEAVISVDLVKGAKPADVQAALKRDIRVAQVKFVTRDEALKSCAMKMGWDLAALKHIGNPLPDSFVVVPGNPNDIPALAADIRNIAGVDPSARAVRYGGQVTQKLIALARSANMASIAITIVLGAAALIIVGTTIRLTIYARRSEIRIMQLVGATNGFIRIPFLIEGMLQGLIGSGLAAVLLLVGYSRFVETVGANLELAQLVYNPQALGLFSVGIVATGLLFGAAGAVLGLRRYLSIV